MRYSLAPLALVVELSREDLSACGHQPPELFGIVFVSHPGSIRKACLCHYIYSYIRRLTAFTRCQKTNKGHSDPFHLHKGDSNFHHRTAQRALSVGAALCRESLAKLQRRSLCNATRRCPRPCFIHLLGPCVHIGWGFPGERLDDRSCVPMSVTCAFLLSLVRGANAVNIEVLVCSQ